MLPITEMARMPNHGLVDDWHKWSRCRGLGSDLFFGGDGADAEKNDLAKTLCGQCPVVKECLRYALLNHEQYGIWGGLTSAERRRTRLPRAIRWHTQRS